MTSSEEIPDAMNDASHLRTHGVHLVVQPTEADRLIEEGLEAQRTVIPVHAGGVRDSAALFAALGHQLDIPHPVSGWDALLSLLASLDEWLAHQCGYVLLLHGLDELRDHAEAAFHNLVSILPNVCDRWRTIGTPFTIVIHAPLPTLAHARSILDHENANLARAALDPWDMDTRPTAVVGPDTTFLS